MDGELRPEKILNTPEATASQEKAGLLDSRKFIETTKPSEQATVAQAVLPDLQTINTATDTNQIILTKVEAILSDNMDNIFLSMDLASQAKFKAKGEEVAIAIANILQKTKVQIKNVIALIVDWLRLIPHVNKYYLEQEAKLKADALLHLYKNNGSNNN